MIQSIEPEAPATSQNYAPLKAGVYQVQLIDIEDRMRVPFGQTGEATEKKYNFKFAVLNTGDNRGRYLWKEVSAKKPMLFKNGKSTGTYPIVIAILDAELTEEEGRAFSLESFNNLIGKQLQVVVALGKKQDGTPKNVITAYTPANGEMEPLTEEELGEGIKPVMETISADVEITTEDIPF